MIFFQTSDLDTFLCKQEWERRLEEELEKPRHRDATSPPPHIDDFFEPAASYPHHNNNNNVIIGHHRVGGGGHQSPPMSYVSMRTLTAVTDDDVFLRPPLWEDIASSIQNIDPENANMLAGVTPTPGAGGHVKLEAVDDLTSVGGCPGGEATPSPLLSPLEIKTEKVRIYMAH